MNHSSCPADTRQSRILAAALTIFACLWLVGCEQHVRVESSWQEGASQNQPFKRILVVGVSPDIDVRCDFEHFLKTQLSSSSTVAIMSCSKTPLDEPLSIEAIDAAVEATDADSVLATILVVTKIGAEEGGKNETRGDAYYKATGTGYAYGYPGYYGGFGRYGVPVTYVEFQTAAPITTIDGEVAIVTRLFETDAGEMVYEVSTLADDLQSTDQALAKISATIAEQLARDGVTR